jgi:hypothetical protein
MNNSEIQIFTTKDGKTEIEFIKLKNLRKIQLVQKLHKFKKKVNGK